MVTKLKPITISRANELVMIDFEQLCESEEGYKGLLMMVDHFSKFTVAAPVMAFTALEAAKAIWERWVPLCGIPETIHSDKGSQFESALFTEVMMHMGCIKTHTSGYHPQGNGLAERQNRTIVESLRIVCGEEKQREWPKHVLKVLLAYNTSVHASTKFTPERVMYGREANLPLRLIFEEYEKLKPPTSVHEYVATQMDGMARVMTAHRENSQQAQIRMVRNHEKRRNYYPILKPGQWAMVFVDAVKKKGYVKKLTKRWRGPYKILKVYTKRVYCIKLENGYKAHYERIRLFEPRMRAYKLANEGDFHWRWDKTGEPYVEIEPEDSAFDPDWDPEAEIDSSEEGVLQQPPRKDMRMRKKQGEQESQRPHESLPSNFDNGKSLPSTVRPRGRTKKKVKKPNSMQSATTNENYISPEREIVEQYEDPDSDPEVTSELTHTGK